MAGNTKLMGFSSIIENSVQLERWGEKADVPISVSSLRALRHACFNDLPKKPPESSNWPDFKTRYGEDVGRVTISMNIETTEILIAALGGVITEHSEELMRELREELKLRHIEHMNYISTYGEPGVP